MELSRAMKQFLGREVASASAEFMYRSMSALRGGRKEEQTASFLDVLKGCIQNPRVRFLQISLVRHRTLQKRSFYCIQTFGKEFYLSPPIQEKELDWKWMYEPYDRFCQRVADESRKYVMQLSKQEVRQICLLELEETKVMVKELFQEVLPHLLGDEGIRRLCREREVEIQLSDYMGAYEPLLSLNQQTEKVGEWMNGIL